jgi:hypothetical protein
VQRAIGSQGTAQVVGAKPGSRPGDLAERGVWTAADAEKQRQADRAFQPTVAISTTTSFSSATATRKRPTTGEEDLGDRLAGLVDLLANLGVDQLQR